ncbi:MAG TPA: integrase arm-type DNA-binding domain-containing protein [Terracidiphilus sp.]|nr:integrase arm-type DNA-binding domain-containing protein [Terracidiphilus sp.]
MALTATEVERSRHADKQYTLWDGDGLYLLVTQTSKLWRYKFRFNGRERLMALGSFPVVTLKAARDKHINARRLLDAGIDPIEHQKQERAQGTTFKQSAEEWFATWSAGKAPAHINRVHARMERDIYPVIGNRAIAKITAPDITALARKVESRGVGETARRVLENCSAVFVHAVASGYAPHNVCADIQAGTILKQTAKRNHARVADDELPKVIAALYAHPGIVTRMAAKLTMYTVLRTANIIALEWEWVNLDELKITFPAEVMKTRSPFVCVLSPAAADVLRFMHEMSKGQRYVFSGHKRGEHLSNGAMLKALRDAGYGGQQTMHSFRAVFSTQAHEHGFEHDHIEAALHHQRKGVTAHYDFSQYLPQRKELMKWWAAWLDEQAAKEPPQNAAA